MWVARKVTRVVPVVACLFLMAGKRADPTAGSDAWAPPAPTSTYHLRTTFDADPSGILGQFVGEGVDAPDDGAGMITKCSQFVTAKEVAAGGTYDVYVQASSSAAASFGIPPLVGISGSGSSGQTVRIQYQLTKKMQYQVTDAAGWQSCCKSGPGLCTSRFVSEFVAGTGTVFYAKGKEGKVAAGGAGSGAAGQLEAHGGYLWQQATSLDGMYFAFKTAPTPGFDSEPALQSGSCDAVTWDDVPPRSTEGVYVVGLSVRADAERDARTLARSDAQRQTLEMCRGADVQCGGSSTSSTGVTGGAATTTESSDMDCTIAFGGEVKSLELRGVCTDHDDTPMGKGAWLVKAAYFLAGGCPGL